MKDDNKIGPQGEILIYQTEKGETGIEVRLEDETVWMAQAGIAELYGTSPQNITMHIRNIFQEGELDEEATCKNYLQVQKEGERDVKRNIRHYNLEVILAVGYRLRSERGTQFRKWATNTFKIDFDREENSPRAPKNETRQLELLQWLPGISSFILFNIRKLHFIYSVMTPRCHRLKL
ncbi:MAG: virulence RhuM family protein [Balneolales bacterium]|nr:virulence RhuM family protein [Balneolales bacterium]